MLTAGKAGAHISYPAVAVRLLLATIPKAAVLMAKKFAAVALCLIFAIGVLGNDAFAHSGNTDRNGCHMDTSNNTRHCHNDNGKSSPDWKTAALVIGGCVVFVAVWEGIKAGQGEPEDVPADSQIGFHARNWEPTLTYRFSDSLNGNIAAKHNKFDDVGVFIGLRYQL